MSTYLYRYPERLNETQLRAYLESIQEDLVWIYIETEKKIHLWWTQPTLMEASSLGLNGRIFGEVAEIRWQWQFDGYDMTCLSERDPGDPWEADPLEFDSYDLERDRRQVMLIGRLGYDSTPESPRWREARFPYPMFYPVETPRERVYLECQDYRIQAVVVMSRLCSVMGGS